MSSLLPQNTQPATPQPSTTGLEGSRLTPSGSRWVAGWVAGWVSEKARFYALYALSGSRGSTFSKNFAHTRKREKREKKAYRDNNGTACYPCYPCYSEIVANREVAGRVNLINAAADAAPADDYQEKAALFRETVETEADVFTLARGRLNPSGIDYGEPPLPPAPLGRDPLVHHGNDKAKFFRGEWREAWPRGFTVYRG